MKIPAIIAILFLQSGLLFSQNTDSAKFYFDKGMQAEKSRLFAVASRAFERAILLNQNYSEAYIENGNVNLEMRKVDAAIVSFSKAYQLQPDSNRITRQLATLYFNNRQFQKAIDFSEKCKDFPDADRIMGVSYYNLEDYGKAQNFLQKAMNKNDQDAEAAYTLGRTYIELENEKAAIPLYQKAISLEPGRNRWMYELGLVYYSQEDYKNALKYINLAGDSGYNKANDYYENQGFAQIYTGDIKSGIKTLNDLLTRKPNNKELINNMANAFYDTKHYDEALTYFTKLLELNPKDAASLYMVGMALQKKGDKQKGQKICDKAIEMDPSLAKNRQKKDMPMGL